MKIKILFVSLILLIAVGALAVRLPDLSARPMHTDEAVHAVRLEQLRQGEYRYDPNEYHGPTLYYCTFPVMWLTGADSFDETDEFTYRIVPVVFGTLLVLLLLACGDGLGRSAAVAAALLTATSPAMVFYSRYYIQEMLLVVFTFGLLVFAWRYVRGGRIVWVLPAGVCLGLMHATKETCIIALAIGAASLGWVAIWRAKAGPRDDDDDSRRIRIWPVAVGLVAAAMVSVAVFSQFGQDFRGTHGWQGPLDSVRTYAGYLNRGTGGEGVHVHPSNFYLRALLQGDGAERQWGEIAMLSLAAIGGVLSLHGWCLGRTNVWLARLLTLYTVAMAVAYSVIPYKTPWCMLGFLHGAILLAGIGTAAAMRLVRYWPLQTLVAVVLLAVPAHLGWQAWRRAYPQCAEPTNPYVYGHSSQGVVDLAEKIEAVAAGYPNDPIITKVIVTGGDYWPLPWYLRRIDTKRVGFWSELPEQPDAPVIVCSADLVVPMVAKLKQKYTMATFEVRPGVELTLWTRNPARFHHRAMGTGLKFAIAGQTPDYSVGVAVEIKELIDEIEGRLSHYRRSSDVSQLRTLQAGQTLSLSEDAFECLRQAKVMYAETDGVFDPTVGALLACWRTDDNGPRRPTEAELAAAKKRTGMDLLALAAGDMSVQVKADNVLVNLGGIGKGYAVDRAIERLRERSVGSAVVNFGHSSVYGLGAPPGGDGWPFTLYDPKDWKHPVAKIVLRDRALGASGISVQGKHIIDPRTAKPVGHRHAACVLAPTATEADALSTAFMIMTMKEVEEYCRRHPDVGALLLERADGERTIRRFGKW